MGQGYLQIFFWQESESELEVQPPMSGSLRVSRDNPSCTHCVFIQLADMLFDTEEATEARQSCAAFSGVIFSPMAGH